MKVWYPVWPVTENWRTEPSAYPTDGDLGAERPMSGRYIVVEAVVQDAGNGNADNQQDKEADKIHPDHFDPPNKL